MKNTLTFVSVMALAGCAGSGGVVPIGKDSYMLSQNSKALGATVGNAQANALREANQYCERDGRVFQIVRLDGIPGAPGRFPEASVQFMCLPPGDPEIGRPKLRKDADTVVELRQ